MENEKISIRHLSTKIMNKEKISASDKSALGELTKYLKKKIKIGY
ncbi:TPA: hypothetical protein ACMDXT_003674 [Vibrio parahaemolyticus]